MSFSVTLYDISVCPADADAFQVEASAFMFTFTFSWARVVVDDSSVRN